MEHGRWERESEIGEKLRNNRNKTTSRNKMPRGIRKKRRKRKRKRRKEREEKKRRRKEKEKKKRKQKR